MSRRAAESTIAVSPMILRKPERRAGRDVAADRRQHDATDRRDLASCRARMRPRAAGAASRSARCASPCRSSGIATAEIMIPQVQERAAERAAGLAEREWREQTELEERQAEDREHDVGRAGDDLDRRLDDPREPAWAGRTRRPRPRSITPIGTAISSPITPSRTVPSIGSRKPPEPAWLTDGLGSRNQQARAQVLRSLDGEEDDQRSGDEAQGDPGGPGSDEDHEVAAPPAAQTDARRPRRRRGGDGRVEWRRRRPSVAHLVAAQRQP